MVAPSNRLPTADPVAFLAVFNGHVPSCGIPPSVVAGRPGDDYVSYFENAEAEQFLLRINRETRVGALWAGDLGWDRPIPIDGGHVPRNLFLGPEETVWLHAAWSAATGQEIDFDAMVE